MRRGRLTILLAAAALARPAAAQEEGAPPAAGKVPAGLAGPSAQARGAEATAPAGAASGAAPAANPSAAPTGEAAGATEEPAGAVGGYSWSDKPRARAKARPRAASPIKRYPPGTPIATYPGFRMLAGGRSLVWVSVSRAVPVRVERAAGRVVYALEGARVEVRNNTNALLTTHFPTPVAGVQLVPTASGMLLVVELREPVELTHTVLSGPRGTMILRVEVPASATVAPIATAPEPADEPAEREVTAEGSLAASGQASARASASASATARASGSASVKVGKGERKRRKKRR